MTQEISTMVKNPRSGRPYTTAKKLMFQEYGHVCHICGHDGANGADHIIPLKDDPDQPIHWSMLKPVHDSNHGPCPTCGRTCNQERGAGPIPPPTRSVYTTKRW